MAEQVEVQGTSTKITSVRVSGFSVDQDIRTVAMELTLVSVSRSIMPLTDEYNKGLVQRARVIEEYIKNGK